MARRIVRCAAVALAAGVALPLAAQRHFPSDQAVRDILQRGVDRDESFGIAAGLIDSNGAARIVTFGRVDRDGGAPLDGNTVFEIGGITKTFTSALAAEMAIAGRIRFQEPVARDLPASARMRHPIGRPITLRDLALETSGLPRLPDDFQALRPSDPYAGMTPQDLYRGFARTRPHHPPGEAFEDSDLGYALLGQALARRARAGFEEILRKRILAPLHMDDTAVTLTPGLRARLAPGHDPQGHRVPNWDFGALVSAGGLHSTARDMLKYLSANLGAATGEPGRALAMTHQIFYPTPDLPVAAGWRIGKIGDREVLWQSGETGGYHAFIGFEPKQRFGLVLLSNSSRNIDTDGLRLLGITEP